MYLVEETLPPLLRPRFEQHCYKTCPEKTYREGSECKACETNCGNCDQRQCYWCEEGFFLLGKPQVPPEWWYTGRTRLPSPTQE